MLCTTDVALTELPKSIAICARLVHFAQGNVHRVAAVDEMAVEGLAFFEFYKLERCQFARQGVDFWDVLGRVISSGTRRPRKARSPRRQLNSTMTTRAGVGNLVQGDAS